MTSEGAPAPFYPVAGTRGLSTPHTAIPLSKSVDHLQIAPAAARLEHVRYAIRDMAVLAEQLSREGKTILPLNIGDPLNFDFCTPPHMIAAVEKAMRDGRNGYAPSLGIPEAQEAI